MPRLDYRLNLEEHLSPQERRLVRLLLMLLNDVRTHLGVQALTEGDVARLWQEQLRAEAAATRGA